MALKVNISDWAAWAPGVTSASEWRDFFNEKRHLDLNCKPDVSFLLPMFRRRLTPLNRMIFAAAESLADTSALTSCPVVFCSRHGELSLSIKLISSIISTDSLSPAGFSISVHNSAAGLLSIHYKNSSAVTAIAAGEDSLKMGLTEAYSQAAESDKVLFIFADEVMPEVYSNFASSQKYPSCLVMTVEKKSGNHVIDTGMGCSFEDIVKNLAEQTAEL